MEIKRRKLEIGDNVLVRDHTSKVFQPKYKDFWIIGLLGKNQVEIKDNHGHTTKVHWRDMKKIPMAEKVCQLYEEEQVGKVRNGEKAVPDSKMPDLGWDITEELEVQEVSQKEHSVPIFPETVIAIALIIIAFLKNIATHGEEIPKISRKAAQAVTWVTRAISHNNIIKRAIEIYRKTWHLQPHRVNSTANVEIIAILRNFRFKAMATTMTSRIDSEQLAVHQIEKQYPCLESTGPS